MLHDLRYAFRTLRRSPMFSAVAVLSLALGIGANTAIFSVMDALLLRRLPIERPEQLVTFGDCAASGNYNAFPSAQFSALYSPPFFDLVRRNARTFEDAAAIESMRVDVHARVGGAAEAELLKVRLVSGNFFSVLHVGAELGRTLTLDDRGPVAVLSHAVWERRFGSNPHILGQTVAFNGAAFTIVGVAPRDFFGIVVGESPDLWMPLSQQKQVQPWLGNPTAQLSQTLWIVARRKPGITMAAAQSEVDALYLGWMRNVAGPSPAPDRVRDMQQARIRLTDASRGVSELRRDFSEPLRILMVVVGVVLLIACVNVANLLLARAAGREREIAVRLAIGAGRGRLIAQFLCESLLLSAAGAVAGLWLASWSVQALLLLVSGGTGPAPLRVGPDLNVLLFTGALSLLTGVGFGLLPALRASGMAIAHSMAGAKGVAATRSGRSAGRWLVAGQVALALFLMIAAGLFLRTLGRLRGASPGFDKERVVVVQLDPNSNGLNEDAVIATFRRIGDRIRALPGVERSAFAMLAFHDGTWSLPLWPAGVPQTAANQKDCIGNRVEPDFFAVMGVPIVGGRGFGPQDRKGAPRVALVNQTMARMIAPEGSPIGKRFVMGIREKTEWEIVGVVRDARYDSLREKPQAMWFVPNDQESGMDGYNDLVIRARGNPAALMSQIRGVVRAEDANFGVAELASLDDWVDRTLGAERLLATLAALFGGLALILAAVGLYGVLAYAVARRTNEIGIRMALGAQSRTVLLMVLGESLTVVAAGIAAGLAAALACGRLVEAQLFGVASHDAVAVGGAVVVLTAVATLAATLPALRASRLDPVSALRE